MESYRIGLVRNPLDANTMDSLGVALCAAKLFEQCLEARLRLMQLHPEFDGINSSVGIARLYLSQLPEALAGMQQESNEDYRLRGLALVYWSMGRRAESEAALNSLTGNMRQSTPTESPRSMRIGVKSMLPSSGLSGPTWNMIKG